MRFTKEQNNFINKDSTRLLLEAPAGSGKTETVAERVRVLTEKDRKVQVVCFTHSARNTLQRRLEAAGIGIEVRTVVSLAHEIVMEALGADSYEVGDGIELAREVCVRGVASAGQLVNLEALTANGAPLPNKMSSEVGEVFDAYQTRKQESNYLSFIDVVVLANGLKKYDWDELIVDEAQDLTPSQYNMLMSFGAKSVTLVGDSLQAIYGFSGVNPDMFDELSKDWEKISLTKSFRVPSGILPAVNAPRSSQLTSVHSGGKITVLKSDYKQVPELLENLLKSGDCVIGATTRQLERVASRVELLSNNSVSRSWEEGELPGSIHFSTVHSAKGGEWERVFVLDITAKGIWSPMDSTEAEAKRLFYVAASRAQEELVLVNIGDKLPWGMI